MGCKCPKNSNLLQLLLKQNQTEEVAAKAFWPCGFLSILKNHWTNKNAYSLPTNMVSLIQTANKTLNPNRSNLHSFWLNFTIIWNWSLNIVMQLFMPVGRLLSVFLYCLLPSTSSLKRYKFFFIIPKNDFNVQKLISFFIFEIKKMRWRKVLGNSR